MKTASPATLAILASGQYLKFEFWQIQLTSGQIYYFTSGDSNLTVGGNQYVGGLIFVREEISQKCGTEVGSLDMTIAPQFDNPGGQPLIAGGAFLSQLRAGILDNAIWTLSKGFFLQSGSNAVENPSTGFVYTPPAIGHQLDTSPGLVPWWQGITSKVEAGRQTADVTLDDTLAILANQQMPRNMIQQGCLHRFTDTGCTAPTTQNTYSGAINGTVTGNSIATNLTPGSFANGFFNLGILTFTSGVLSGSQFTVSNSVSTAGVLTTIMPFPTAPAIADTFTVLAGCDKTFPMCKSGKFKNSSGASASFALHFRGYPFVPQPETLYDGGTGSQALSTQGSQGSPGAGSPYSGVQSN
jgi:uncharacterized phage protein (TIGR02218 family)